ncbi:MAG: thermonuclease family protein [Polyangiales bacterium]|nr:thermonuclease family protein [Myxococcales bacterium]
MLYPRTKRARAFALLLGGLVALLSSTLPVAASEPASLVFINGKAFRVYFNDGDSFRVLSGSRRGQKSRLGGFNTLESFGATHSWGNWNAYELYVNAKQATLNARRGVWHCTTDDSVDGYGRTLLYCPDLIVDSLRKGLAMAYTIDDTPSPPEYLRAQREAQEARRGMWAHGVPEFIVTSVHSAADSTYDHHYNRLISTRDGHTEKWEHNDSYAECANVCSEEVRPDREQLKETARRMRENAELAPLLKDWFNINLEEFAARWVRSNDFPSYLDENTQKKLGAFFAEEKAAGRLGKAERVRGSCMVYADFKRRYGRDAASCLHSKEPPK